MTPAQKSKFKGIGKSLIKVGLPTLGTALGGPAGGLIGAALGTILGVDAGDDTALDAAIASASPDTLVKLRELEAQVATAELSATENETNNLTARHAADMQSQSWLSQNIRPFVTVALLTFFFAYVTVSTIALFWHFIKAGVVDQNLNALITMFGLQIVTLLTTAIGFYFGFRGYENYKLGKPRDRE